MLESLKAYVLKSTPLVKTEAETLLEQVEQGQQDRAQRLSDEERQRQEAARQALQAQVRQDDAAVRQLIAQHRTLAQAFETALGQLATVAAQVSDTQASIDRLRTQVWQAQRDLGAHALDLEPYAYTAIDLLPAVVSKLRR
jgi:hypothetical protein